MNTKRFKNTTNHDGDPMRVPPNLATSKVPPVQPLRSKMILLDEDDPGYSTELVMMVTDGPVRLLSYAVEMRLVTALMEYQPSHTEDTAREALAQLVVAHNLRSSAQRTDAAGAIAWLAERLAGQANQWNPSELAVALNERAAERRESAREIRNNQEG